MLVYKTHIHKKLSYVSPTYHVEWATVEVVVPSLCDTGKSNCPNRGNRICTPPRECKVLCMECVITDFTSCNIHNKHKGYNKECVNKWFKSDWRLEIQATHNGRSSGQALLPGPSCTFSTYVYCFSVQISKNSRFEAVQLPKDSLYPITFDSLLSNNIWFTIMTITYESHLCQ